MTADHNLFQNIEAECNKIVLESEHSIRRILIAILSGGHILLEGMPGLAKTLLAETFASVLAADFKRIQFTPDLLPADLIGGQVYNPQTGEFSIRKGPLFSQIILADEINRASAKVQAALLESMEEKKISLAGEDYKLEEPYIVLATQNPIEQEGTFPLPEAQLDRFMFKLIIDYPSEATERSILDIHGKLIKEKASQITDSASIIEARRTCEAITVDDSIKDYITKLVRATRNPADVDESLKGFVQAGASPRAGLSLLRGAKANAISRRP